MSLITFFLLGAFSLLYIGKTWDNKPSFVNKALDFVQQHMDQLSMGGVIFGLVMVFLTPLMENSTSDLMVRLFANCMLVILALPYAFNGLVKKFKNEKNDALIEETQNFIGLILKKETTVGVIGTIATLLLFAVLFR